MVRACRWFEKRPRDPPAPAADHPLPNAGDDLDLITGLPKGAKPPVIPDEVIEARKGPKKAEPMPVAGAPTNQLPRPPRNRDHAKELNNDDELDLVTGLPKSRSGGSIASRGSTARAFQEDPDEDVDVITGEKRAIFSHKFPPTNSHRKE